MFFALGAAIPAFGVSAALAALMAPLAIRSVRRYRAGIEAVVVVYWMIFLSVAGTTIYSVWITGRCLRELRRPSR